jgi:hypothetical protein
MTLILITNQPAIAFCLRVFALLIARAPLTSAEPHETERAEVTYELCARPDEQFGYDAEAK